MTLSREMRKDLNHWLLPRLALPLVMVLVAQLGVYVQQKESTDRATEIEEQVLDLVEQIRLDSLRSRHSATQHRVRQEKCVALPIDRIIRFRLDERTDKPIERCKQEEFLKDLEAEEERLEQRLRELGAFKAEGG